MVMEERKGNLVAQYSAEAEYRDMDTALVSLFG